MTSKAVKIGSFTTEHFWGQGVESELGGGMVHFVVTVPSFSEGRRVAVMQQSQLQRGKSMTLSYVKKIAFDFALLFALIFERKVARLNVEAASIPGTDSVTRRMPTKAASITR